MQTEQTLQQEKRDLHMEIRKGSTPTLESLGRFWDNNKTINYIKYNYLTTGTGFKDLNKTWNKSHEQGSN